MACPTRLVGALCAGLAVLPGQCEPEWRSGGSVPGANGPVLAMARWDPDGPGPAGELAILGGDFQVAGDVIASHVVGFDPATGAYVSFGQGFNEQVRAFATLPTGDLVAAGDFTHSGSAVVNRIARWNGSQWLPLAGGTNAAVYDLAVAPNGDLIAGGHFTTAGGTAVESVARWDGATWHSVGAGGPIAFIKAIQFLPSGDLIAGGAFFASGGFNAIARWDGAQWHALGTGLTGDIDGVDALTLLQNGDLVAGGGFTHAGGVASRGLARWDGAAWHAMNHNIFGGLSRTFALATLQNGDLVGAGYRAAYWVSGIVRWDGTSWHTYPNTNLIGGQALLELSNGDLLVGGTHWGANGVTVHVLRFAAGNWQPLPAPGGVTNDAVRALLTTSSGDVIAGGRFTRIRGVAARRVARWDGSAWHPLGGGRPSGPGVNALAELPNGDIVVGGETEVARWDGTQWHVLPHPLMSVYSLAALPNGDLIAGGHAGTTAVIKRWRGTAWQQIYTGLAGFMHNVVDLAVLPNGDFVAADDGLATVQQWNGGGWQSLGTTAGSPDTVFVDSAGTLYCATRLGIQRWDGVAWQWVGGPWWSPASFFLDLAELPNGDLVAGGGFASVMGLPARSVARWDGAAWSPFGSGVGGHVHALAFASSGDLVVGGQFPTAGTLVSQNLARLAPPCPAEVDTLATTCVGPAGPVELVTADRPWVGSTFRSSATGFTPGSLAVALLGLGSPNVPLTWLWANTLPGCDQLASQEAILLTLSQGGASTFAFDIPNDPVFAGVVLFHQFLHFEVTGSGGLGSLSSSNGLELTVGVF